MSKLDKKEAVFQILLHGILLIFIAFDKHHPHIHLFQIAFFANYAAAAFLINYFLLPRFYYKKKYWAFLFGVLFLVIAAILIEELVLEKIYFPDTRGRIFAGFFYSLLDVMPTITILTSFKFAWDAHQKHKEVALLRQTIKESELKFLKSQINPHFLFNNLNNLYSYALEQSPKTPSIILELSSVLRYILYECKEDYVPLSKEIAHLQNFTQLNQLQIEERGIVRFTTEPFRGDFQIAPLILSVFIENAFKHSTASQNKDISIEINIAVSEAGILHFECKNSFSETGNTQGLTAGIGLENVKKRLELIYPQKHKLNINHTQSSYAVFLEIELT